VAYKAAVMTLLTQEENHYHYFSYYPICRELFALIGSLFSFTKEELAMKIDLMEYAHFDIHSYDVCEDKDNVEDDIIATEEEVEDDRLYLDEERMTFRFHSRIDEERNMDPQCWSIATLKTWLKRVCYD
jgi:hypothetical protein